MKKEVIILLHEIYGVNEFIRKQSEKWMQWGYDVVRVDFYQKAAFSYKETDVAYSYFMEMVGFERYTEISDMIDELKKRYEKVWVMGYSVGATMAWRCCENLNCDGIIACYGSRIRNYMGLHPVCPVLLLFAEQDSFPVAEVAERIRNTTCANVFLYPAEHGFMDGYSGHYHAECAERAEEEMKRFLFCHS